MSSAKTDFDLDVVPAASIMTLTVLCRRAGRQSLAEQNERGFLVLVRNRTAAEQTDLCEKVRVVRKGGARAI